jgi:glycosyltransferase involved in cell wall biosynthesis
LFAWRRCTPPFFIGGAEVSQQLLAEAFGAAGWHIIYVGSYEPPWNGPSELSDLRGHLAASGVPCTFDERHGELRYRWNGVECRCVPQAAVTRVLDTALREHAPELLVTSQEGADELAGHARGRTPVAGWVHSVSRTGMAVLGGRPQFALAVSRFVLSRMDLPRGTKPVLCYPPFVPPPESDEAIRRSADLLMINPVPAKGGQLVAALAKHLLDRRFTLVEGWWDTSARFAGLSNVRYVKRTYAIATFYAQHRLLLVPSVVEDAFPRVIIEAGLAGLPTIGSSRGGIPEAIADGGLVIHSGEPAAWASAVATMEGPVWEIYAQRVRQRARQLVRDCIAELVAAGVIAAT